MNVDINSIMNSSTPRGRGDGLEIDEVVKQLLSVEEGEMANVLRGIRPQALGGGGGIGGGAKGGNGLSPLSSALSGEAKKEKAEGFRKRLKRFSVEGGEVSEVLWGRDGAGRVAR